MESREEIYDKIAKYPLPDHIITYRPYNSRIGSKRTSFDDLIYLNLKELIPNVRLGLYHKHNTEDIKQWIQMTKSYGDKVNEQFQEYCNEKLLQVEQIERVNQQTSRFDHTQVKKLPLDIQERIQSYLMPETRIIILEDKYKTLRTDMKKWKVDQLKIFLKNVVCDVYEPKCYENYTMKSLPDRETIYKSCTNKDQYIREIFKLYDLFKKVVPKSDEKYCYYWGNALKLLTSILYVHKKVVPAKITPVADEKKKKKYKIVNKEK